MKVEGFGSLYQRPRSRLWWAKYYVGGKCIRKSTGCENKKDAVNFLKQVQGQISAGKYHPNADKTSFEDLISGLLNHYAVNGKKSLRHVKTPEGGEKPHLDQLPALREFFGKMRAKQITLDVLDAYVAHRLSQGRAPATAKNELAVLKRALRLAERAGKATCPAFPSISVQNARQGFFEREPFERALSNLPEDLRAPMEFAYLTGWRLGEILSLQWRQVDFKAGVLRLEVGSTKNNDGRTLPFDVLPALKNLLESQRARTTELEHALEQVIPWTFHRRGKEIKDFRGAWNKACEDAGIPGMLRHDLRRTAVRNLERAGVPRSVAMKITGHRTESVYRRYAITNENDLREGLRKLARLHEADGGGA